MSFYVWATNRGQQSACTYYRIMVPMAWMERLGYTQGYIDVGKGGEDDIAAMFTADVDLFYAAQGAGTLHQMEVINAMQPKKIQDGSLHYPPTTVWDCDDNSDFVHPFNQTFATQGVRHYPTADFLEPDDVLTSHDAKGREHVLWIDGKTRSGQHTFDIQRNLAEMKLRHKIIRTAVGVTVSSPSLASYVRDVVGQKNVYVFPNTVVPSDYEEYPVSRDDDDIRILWQGGMSHFIDWYPLREAVAAVFQKYPKAKLVLWGEKFDWISDVIPPERLEYHLWTDYAAFKLKRGLLRIDINLCPLAANPFNACKTAIKWYEGSVWSRPEATLAANFGPYQEIKDGETGLLYRTPEEFAQKLGVLIEDAQLRARLGQEAKRWVLDNRTPEKTIPGLYEFYQDCRARTRRGRIIAPSLEQVRKVS
jgi:glycosyl transferase family 1